MRSWCGLRLETCRPRHFHGKPEGSHLRNPGRLIFLPPLTIPKHSSALDVCAWPPPIAAAARGDAAQAAFGRKLSHCSPLAWTADGRPHPAVTRTLQPERAADVGEIAPPQVEARNPNRSLAVESSRGSCSSAKPFSASRVALRRHY